MLVIRLMRTGKKNQPFFRFVVTDKKNSSTAGRTTEILGFYNPLTKERKIDRERAKYWLSVGAKSSDTVFNFLVSEKVIEGKKIPQHKKSKHAPIPEKPAEAAVPAVAKESETKEEASAEKKKEEVVMDKPADANALADKPAETAEPSKPEE